MPTVKETLSNPDFYNLPSDDARIEVLKKVDPNDFGLLPKEVQLGIIKSKNPQPDIKAPLPEQLKNKPKDWIDKTNEAIDRVHKGVQYGEDLITDFARPIISSIAGGAAGAVSGGVGTVPAYLATDAVMQHLKNNQDNQIVSNVAGFKPGGAASTIANSVENLASGALLDKTLGPIVKYGASKLAGRAAEKAIPGSIVDKKLSDLGPTFSQYFGGGGVSQWIEDTFAASSKMRAMKESAQKGYAAFENLVTGISGRAKSVLGNPQEYANKIALEGARNQFEELGTHIANNENTLRMIGQSNPNPILRGFREDGSKLLANRPGAVDLGTIKNEINTFRNSLRGKVLTEPDQTVLETINKIEKVYDPLEVADPNKIITDPQTGLQTHGTTNTGARPISVKDALDYRKVLDQLTKDPKTKTMMLTDGNQANEFFAKLKGALDDDIQSSIPHWQNNPYSAAHAFDNMRFMENAQKEIFSKDGLAQLLKNPDITPSSQINSILSDSQKLQRAVDAGQIKIPGKNGTIKIQSSNIKDDLAAYRLMQILHDNSSFDPVTKTRSIVNTQNMIDTLNDPKMAESTKILFGRGGKGSTLDNINEFLANVSKTQTGVPKKIGWGKDGLMLASNLFNTALGGVPSGITALRVTGAGVGKLFLNNPERARLLVALAKGAPIGMSLSKASELLTKGMQGMIVAGIDQAGNEHKLELDKEGKFNQVDSTP